MYYFYKLYQKLIKYYYIQIKNWTDTNEKERKKNKRDYIM